jgi:hypothetical protein
MGFENRSIQVQNIPSDSSGLAGTISLPLLLFNCSQIDGIFHRISESLAGTISLPCLLFNCGQIDGLIRRVGELFAGTIFIPVTLFVSGNVEWLLDRIRQALAGAILSLGSLARLVCCIGCAQAKHKNRTQHQCTL